MKIIRRAEAKAAGLKRYFTGKECPRGHVAEKLVSTRRCILCNASDLRLWEKANPNIKSEYGKRHYTKHLKTIRIRALLHRQANPEVARERTRLWKKQNPEKEIAKNRCYYHENSEKILKQTKQYRERYPEKRAASRAVRRMRQRSISLTKDERKQICAIYKRRNELTASTGIEHHVDHIIPLARGGIHHPDNLQILTATENLHKSARLAYYERAKDALA